MSRIDLFDLNFPQYLSDHSDILDLIVANIFGNIVVVGNIIVVVVIIVRHHRHRSSPLSPMPCALVGS